MKIKEIAKLAKRNGELTLLEPVEGRGVQWVSVGNAAYPLYGMPDLDRDTVTTVLDLSEKELKKINVSFRSAFKDYEYSGYVDNQAPLEHSELPIKIGDITYNPVKTSKGLMFYNPDFLKPIRDEESEIYERKTPSGKIYFSVQHGTFVQALIMPEALDEEDLVMRLRKLVEALEDKIEANVLDRLKTVTHYNNYKLDTETGEVIEEE